MKIKELQPVSHWSKMYYCKQLTAGKVFVDLPRALKQFEWTFLCGSEEIMLMWSRKMLEQPKLWLQAMLIAVSVKEVPLNPINEMSLNWTALVCKFLTKQNNHIIKILITPEKISPNKINFNFRNNYLIRTFASRAVKLIYVDGVWSIM